MPNPSHSTQSGRMRFDPNATVWTCFGCDHQEPESDNLTQWCPKCGGVWVRELPLSRWQARIRRRFRRARTFDNADELIAWLERDDD